MVQPMYPRNPLCPCMTSSGTTKYCVRHPNNYSWHARYTQQLFHFVEDIPRASMLMPSGSGMMVCSPPSPHFWMSSTVAIKGNSDNQVTTALPRSGIASSRMWLRGRTFPSLRPRAHQPGQAATSPLDRSAMNPFKCFHKSRKALAHFLALFFQTTVL